jgi:hypothetical protein
MVKYVVQKNWKIVRIYNYIDNMKYNTLEEAFAAISERIGKDFVIQSNDGFNNIYVYERAGTFLPIFKISKEVE